MPEIAFEEVALFLPKYLSPTKQQGLWEEIKKFPAAFCFYDLTGALRQELLQGDGWRGFIAINFITLDKRTVSGVIISNTCDVNVKNKHDYTPNILFAPILKLNAFGDLLTRNGLKPESIESKLAEIRRQQVSNIFFLPRQEGLIEESIILLDDIHHHPLDHFLQCEPAKLFTLSLAGFYLFLIKISSNYSGISVVNQTIKADTSCHA